MNILSGIIGKGKLALSGLNWTLLAYKFIAYALLIVAVGITAYREGKHDCEQAASEAKITVLETQIVSEREIVIRELDKKERALVERLGKLQDASIESAKMQADLIQIRKALHDAINNRPGNAACAPSTDELRQYDEISRRTRAGKNT